MLSKNLLLPLSIIAFTQAGFGAPKGESGKDPCRLGREQYAAGDVLKAKASLLKCLDQDAKNHGAWVSLGNAYLETGLFKEAAEAYGKANALQPGNKAVLTQQLDALDDAGLVAEQIPVLKALIDLKPKDRKLAERMIRVLEATGTQAHADDYLAALEALGDPGSDREHAEKLAAAYLARGQHARAEGLYRRLLNIRTESPEYWAGLGACLAARKSDSAAEAYRKAVLFADDARLRETYRKELARLESPAAPAVAAKPPSGEAKPAPVAAKAPEPVPAKAESPAKFPGPAAVKPAEAKAPPEVKAPSAAAKAPPSKPFDRKAFEDSVFKAELEKRMAALKKDGDKEAEEKKAKAEEDRKAKAEAEKKAREDSLKLAKEEKARTDKARADSLKAAQEEKARLAKARSDSLAKAESDRKALAEAKRKARADSLKAAQEEKARLAKARSDSLAKAEADRKALAEAKRKARADSLKAAQEEKARLAKARSDSLAKAEADRKALAEAKRKAREDSLKAAQEEKTRLAKVRADSVKAAREENTRLAKARADSLKAALAEKSRLAKLRADSLLRAEEERRAQERLESQARLQAKIKLQQEKARLAREDSIRAAEEAKARKAQAEKERLERQARLKAFEDSVFRVALKRRQERDDSLERAALAKKAADEAKAKQRADSLARAEALRVAEAEAKAKRRADSLTHSEAARKAMEAKRKLEEEKAARERLEKARVDSIQAEEDRKAKAAAEKREREAQLAKARADSAQAEVRRKAEEENARKAREAHLKQEFELAEREMQKGEKAKAAARFANVLEQKPDHAEAGLNLGLALADLDSAAPALPHLEKGVAKYPKNSAAWKALGKSQAALQKNDDAWKSYGKALELKPSDAEAARGRLAVARKTGREADMLAAYGEVLRAAPGDAPASAGLAAMHFQRREYAEAARHYKTATTKSRDKDLWAQYARALMETKNFDEAAAALRKAAELGEKGAGLRLDLARIHLQKGELDKAEALASEVEKQHPGDARAAYLHGSVARKRHQPGVALDHFRKANALQPQEAAYAQALARELRERDECGQALAVLERAQEDLDAEGRLLQGDCYALTGNEAKALAAYDTLYGKSPSAPLLARRMDLRVHMGKPDQAAALGKDKQFGESPEVAFTMARAQLAMASSQSSRADLDLAVDLMRKLVKREGRNPEYRHHLGLAYFAQGRHKQALSEFETALRYRADYPEALYYKGLAHVKLKRPAEAQDPFRELAQHAKPTFKAKGLYGLALLFEAEGKWEAVEHHLVQSLAAHPQADAMAFLSRVCLQTGRAKDAEDWARKALEKSPHHVEGTIALAEALASRKQFPEARALAMQAMRAKPFSCGLWVQTAKLNHEAGDVAAVLAVGDSVIALCPEEPMAYFYTGSANLQSKKTEEAKRYFKTFRKLGGDAKLLPKDY